ncbi:MAG: cell wall-binding repeat-containing protein, partial [Coriobacteriia bacterium]|nr:cell wall-binding repeat-containing protein [Coriobacteriia bacterium]
MSIRGKHRIATALVVALVAALVPFAAPVPAVAAPVATPSAQLRSVSMIDASTAVAVATNGTIWRSTAAGNGWESVRGADAYDFRAVDFWNATKGVAVDLQGKVAWTTDGGVTWTNVDFTPYVDMDGLTAPKSHNGLACIPGTTDAAISVGGDPDILDDTNIGAVAMRTWGQISFWQNAFFQAQPYKFDIGDGQMVDIGEGEFLDVSFVNGTQGWAVGRDTYEFGAHKPALYRTTNTGGSWTALSLGYPSTLNAVAFGSATAGVVAGQLAADGAPRAYYTTNGGSTWSEGTLPAGIGIPRALHMTSATNGWLAGDGGTLLRTTDGGQTWTACVKPAGYTANLYDVELIGTTGIAVGDSAVLTTTDGITWYRPDITPPTVVIVSTSHPVATTWYATREVAATLSASDSSGIVGYAVVLDQSAATIPDAVVTQAGAAYTATLPSDGEWYLHVRAVDTRGNWSGTQHRLFRADTAPPVTTSDAAGPYAGSATITLSPSDPTPGSGVASTNWSLDGGGSGTGTTVNVTAEGDWTLRYYSTDVAGNAETEKTATFAVEIAPGAPAIASATHPNQATSYASGAFSASWTASDASGVAGYAVAFDASASTVPAQSVTQTGSSFSATVPAGTTRYLHVCAVDTRGNWGSASHYKVTVGALTTTAVAGADRIATAIAAAKVAFPSGAGTVVIATARNWPDALGGAALAGAVDGPILLTEPTALPSTVAQAISDLGASKAIILGGTAAVSSGVQTALGTALGGAGNVTRIDGADRYETARKVAAETVKRLGTFSGTAFIATGANFPD